MNELSNNKDEQFQLALTQFGLGTSPFDTDFETTKTYLQDFCNILSPSDKDAICSNFSMECLEDNKMVYQFIANKSSNAKQNSSSNQHKQHDTGLMINYNDIFVGRRAHVVESPSLSSTQNDTPFPNDNISNTCYSGIGSLNSEPKSLICPSSIKLAAAPSETPASTDTASTSAPKEANVSKRNRKRQLPQAPKPQKNVFSSKNNNLLADLKSFPLTDALENLQDSPPNENSSSLETSCNLITDNQTSSSITPSTVDTPGPSRQIDRVKLMEDEIRQKMEKLQVLQMENTELKFRHNLMEQLIGIRSHQILVVAGPAYSGPLPLLQHFSNAVFPPNPSTTGTGLHALLGCSVMNPFLSQPERDRFSRISKESFISQWKMFLAEASVCLLALESNSKDMEATSRLSGLCDHCAYVSKHTCLLAPHTLLKVMSTNMETGEIDNIPTPEYWDTLIPIIVFSSEQEERLLFMHELFVKVMSKIIKERRHLQDELHQGLQTALDIHRAMRQMELHPECLILKKLSLNLQRELWIHELLRGYFFGRTLTVFQFAKLTVYSYPYYPDATAIICRLAALQETKRNVNKAKLEAQGGGGRKSPGGEGREGERGDKGE